jgi:hypothetical protein
MAIYVGRGLDPSLAEQVADQLMTHDAIGAHARDELGMSETLRARPIQAALASASSFAVGAAMPLIVTALAPEAHLIIFVTGTLRPIRIWRCSGIWAWTRWQCRRKRVIRLRCNRSSKAY